MRKKTKQLKSEEILEKYLDDFFQFSEKEMLSICGILLTRYLFCMCGKNNWVVPIALLNLNKILKTFSETTFEVVQKSIQNGTYEKFKECYYSDYLTKRDYEKKD